MRELYPLEEDEEEPLNEDALAAVDANTAAEAEQVSDEASVSADEAASLDEGEPGPEAR